ncbi:isocitrate lyase/PEP mutase family protein [Polaromonas sp. SM01]|uniref:isocitrate lyase/PEP mutase family protein n=1 Tax=Polaromonas sp. SM01 TaxID=3085630 RepID=UPI00298213DE|nr:isocitrate lyase/PEP mutase family protein [Polaromonas sp. SM01]MDW5444512.1 isocitrate lyase/PEP mutase family protein [Polaromonas sp. SM01]
MTTFRELVASERPLVLPGAHDALSALLIKQAGFKAYFVGGFPVAGVRYGVPDIGLLGGREFADAYRDILAVSDLPVLVDADNGYGDHKNVVHLVHSLERLGAQALFFEDQVSPKRCGHIAGKALVDTREMESKIRAAAGERMRPDTFIIARTDAREVVDMDEALRRGERYLRAGADGLFIEAPVSIEEMRRIGETFDVPLLANMLEGGRTPILKPVELEELGFRIVIYGISLLMRATRSMQETLRDIASGELKLSGTGVSFEEYKSIVGMDKWARIEDQYR